MEDHRWSLAGADPSTTAAAATTTTDTTAATTAATDVAETLSPHRQPAPALAHELVLRDGEESKTNRRLRRLCRRAFGAAAAGGGANTRASASALTS